MYICNKKVKRKMCITDNQQAVTTAPAASNNETETNVNEMY